jgi:hypothetical protein
MAGADMKQRILPQIARGEASDFRFDTCAFLSENPSMRLNGKSKNENQKTKILEMDFPQPHLPRQAV